MWYRVLIAALVSYLLGNLNGAVCVSSLVSHDDVRKHGSGNAGLTNFIRSYGAGKALFVILIDAGKAVIACLVGRFLLRGLGYGVEGSVLGGVCVMLGHVFPVLLGFKGGKGILSGLFIAVATDWRVALLILVIFAVVYFATRYVSLGSVLAALGFGVGFAVLYWGNPWVMAGGAAMSALTIFMHRSNIVRLIRGEERKTDLFAKKKAE